MTIEISAKLRHCVLHPVGCGGNPQYSSSLSAAASPNSPHQRHIDLGPTFRMPVPRHQCANSCIRGPLQHVRVQMNRVTVYVAGLVRLVRDVECN